MSYEDDAGIDHAQTYFSTTLVVLDVRHECCSQTARKISASSLHKDVRQA